MKKTEVITCPKCGREYLPAEIFVPNAFFGRPRDIVRDVYGTILDYEGTSLDVEETYTCDKCNTTFNIKARCSFATSLSKFENIDEEYSTKIKQNTLFSE